MRCDEMSFKDCQFGRDINIYKQTSIHPHTKTHHGRGGH